MKRISIGVAVVIGAVASPAVAQTGEAARAAQRAFEEGMALLKAGDHARACPKLEESQRIQPAMGAQFRLAECYEASGKLASAWRTYLDVALAAREANKPERESHARAKADALQSRLSRITITAPPAVANLEGLAVAHNGVVVPTSRWGSVPVDPGTHRFEASARGKKPWSVELDIVREAQQLTVKIPSLEDEMARAEPAPAPKRESKPDVEQAPPLESAPATPVRDDAAEPGLGAPRIAAIALASAGVVAIGAGIGVGFAAKSRWEESASFCGGDACTQDGVDIRTEARSTGNVGTVVASLGFAAIGGGALTWLLAPSHDGKAESRASAWALPTSSGFSVGGALKW